MKISKGRFVEGLLALSILFMCFLYLYNQYQTAKDTYRHELTDSFKKAINLEYDKRMSDMNISFAIVRIEEEEPMKGVMMERDGGIIHREDIDSAKMSLSSSEKLFNSFQTYLLYKNPLDVFVVDSFLQIELTRKKIKAKTAVMYIEKENNKDFCSNPNVAFYNTTFVTEKIKIGLFDEIVLQGFAQITPLAIIKNAKEEFFAISIACLFVLYIFFFLKRKYK